jgi:hypothetical protein
MFDSAMYLKGGAMATSIGTAKQQALLQACFYQRFTSERLCEQWISHGVLQWWSQSNAHWDL